MNIGDSMAQYKLRKLDKYRSFDQWIIDTGLKPGIDAKDFYKAFDTTVAAKPNVDKRPDNFNPTHIDIMFDRECEIRIDEFGVYHMRWDNGVSGSYPPCNLPAERFIEVPNDNRTD